MPREQAVEAENRHAGEEVPRGERGLLRQQADEGQRQAEDRSR
jgi:hypothetical protein